METTHTHTPKRDAIQRFIGHESGLYKDWIVRAVDEPDNPVVQIQAFRDDKRLGDPDKTLEIHTRQVRLEDDELDEAAKTMIRRWLQALQ